MTSYASSTLEASNSNISTANTTFCLHIHLIKITTILFIHTHSQVLLFVQLNQLTAQHSHNHHA